MNAVREAARLLAAAERPVIVADKFARTAEGVKLLVQLAESLQAPVVDQKGRMNFPNTHHLFQNARGQALLKEADVILGLELSDYWGTVNGYVDNGENDGAGLQESHIKPNAKLISISSIAAQHQVELPGLPAFPGRGYRHGGRRASDAAGADRGGEAGGAGESRGEHRGARHRR